jgi:hypothetical protein
VIAGERESQNKEDGYKMETGFLLLLINLWTPVRSQGFLTKAVSRYLSCTYYDLGTAVDTKKQQ